MHCVGCFRPSDVELIPILVMYANLPVFARSECCTWALLSSRQAFVVELRPRYAWSPQRTYAASGNVCGCFTYVHPYGKQRSCVLDFLHACVCPLGLAANEKALHELSEGGVRSTSGLCFIKHDASAEVAGCSMATAAWLALLPCLWPLLGFLSFSQRQQTVKTFRIEQEMSSTATTACKAVFCMPCSLWQVNAFLQERLCEEYAPSSCPVLFTQEHLR